MKAMINIGNEVPEATMSRVTAAIESIFRVGFETHMEQVTIQKALEVVERIAVVQGVSITGCTLKGDTHLHANDSEEGIKLGSDRPTER